MIVGNIRMPYNAFVNPLPTMHWLNQHKIGELNRKVIVQTVGLSF